MSSAAYARSSESPVTGAPSFVSHVTCNAAPILDMQGVLKELAARTGQSGAMDDLDYFLARPQIRKKTPYLISLSSQTSLPEGSRPSIDAALLLYEHHVGGHGIRIFTTDDTTGRRTLISPSGMRTAFALTACQELLTKGAQIILLSFRHDDPRIDVTLEKLLQGSGCNCRWASREREIAGHLPFEATLEGTLALIGTRTRNHLRYYRRRAENQLGSVFVPDAQISREDFIALNRISAYPVTDEVAEWRYDSLKELKSPILYGMRDRDGRWLSLIGGRHFDCNMEMYWQMNRADMPSQSLGTAMRAFLIEHEVNRGTRRMYVEGGTTHSMSHAFVREKSTDLIVMRQSPVTRVLPGLVKRFLPPENMLLQVLEDTTLEWRAVRRS